MKIPKTIKNLGDGLQIVWRDGLDCILSSSTLRENCPSAVSKAQRGDTSHDAPLTSTPKKKLRVLTHTRAESLKLKAVEGIGNYAIRLVWADGHNSGIYSFTLLHSLCKSMQ